MSVIKILVFIMALIIVSGLLGLWIYWLGNAYIDYKTPKRRIVKKEYSDGSTKYIIQEKEWRAQDWYDVGNGFNDINLARNKLREYVILVKEKVVK